jgi:hypothetical protein
MAIIKLGETVVGLRGTIGGITFSQNGSGTYAKKLAHPVRKNTVLQAARRSSFSQCRQDWAAVTPAQYADWDALAIAPPEIDHNSLGDVILINASHWHTRVNMRRLQAGQAIERECPVNSGVAAPDSFGLTIYITSNLVDDSTFEYTEDDFDGFYAALFLAFANSTVRTVQSTGYRCVWCTSIEGDTSTRINEELVATFGTLTAGQNIFGRLYKQSTTGIRSTYQATNVVVKASP